MKRTENDRTDIDWDKDGERRFIWWGIAACAMFFLLTQLMLMSVGCAETMVVCTSGGALNGRLSPGGEVEYLFPNGERLDVQSINDGWAAVEYGGDTIYCAAEYLTLEGKDVGTYTVRANGRVRVRETPGGKRVRYAHNGDRVTVERWACDDSGECWAYVGDGYISADYLKEDTENE